MGVIAPRPPGRQRLAPRRVGAQTVAFARPPAVIGTGAVVGPLEGQGPLGKAFDHVYADLTLGQTSFELAEREMFKNACLTALNRAGAQPADVDFFLAGDLLNQLISANFTALTLSIPFAGLYGACSTLCESLSLGAMLLDGGFADRVLVATGSHYATAERQYRYPTEYGGQRKPYAQWTTTGAGAALLAADGSGPVLTHATLGRVVDMGVKDPFNQGAAMAPAAVQTLVRHLLDLGRTPADYDLIVTGDLGRVGRELAVQLAATEAGITLGANYQDCGMLLYDRQQQDVHAGGSGCGCSAVVVLGHLLAEMQAGRLRRLLVVATGALLSPTSFQQGESIPGVAHAVTFEQGQGAP